MTTQELIRAVDERLAVGSDEDLVALASEVEEHLAERSDDAVDLRERLAWRASRLAFVLRALDL